MTDTYTPALTNEQIAKVIHDRVATKILAGEPIDPQDWFDYARAIERAAIEAYQRQQWRPIETAPKDGTRILVWRKPELGYEHVQMGVDRWCNRAWWQSRSSMQPIAWMPLPPPPEAEE